MMGNRASLATTRNAPTRGNAESGRRDSNPRPSPWQKQTGQLLDLRVFEKRLHDAAESLTASDRHLPPLTLVCAFVVGRVPQGSVPQDAVGHPCRGASGRYDPRFLARFFGGRMLALFALLP
jgi:hypothetical protein